MMNKKNKNWSEEEINELMEAVLVCLKEYSFNNQQRRGTDWYKVASKVNSKFNRDRTPVGCQVKHSTEKKRRRKEGRAE